jgi:NADH:ubiquinone oxidoreductase subunit 5 (subunit L)/multisubunit Na+/H+ antiporter MnhA subunit
VRHSINPVTIVNSSPVIYGFYRFFQHRWYINAFYYKAIVYPIEHGSSWFFRNFEQKIIEPINIGAPEFGGEVSGLLRRIQTGIEEEYLFAFGVGIAMLIIIFVIFGHVAI